MFFLDCTVSNMNEYPDYTPFIEPFRVTFKNMSITDNNLFKGLSSDWMYKVGLF